MGKHGIYWNPEQKKAQRELSLDRLQAEDENERVGSSEDRHNDFRLLGAIISGHSTRHYDRKYLGLGNITRGVIVARIMGFTFQDISLITKEDRNTIKNIFIKGIKHLIGGTIPKCFTCHFRKKGDLCKVWNKRIHKKGFCWCHLEKIHGRRSKARIYTPA